VKRERPAPVFVVALAGLLLGGAGAAGAVVVQMACWALGGPSSPGAVVPAAPDTAEYLRNNLPGFRSFEALLPATALLLAVLVLAAGLALLGMRGWARAAAMGTAGAVLLVQLATLIYEFAVVLPGIERWREDGAARGHHYQTPSPDLVPAELQWVALALLIGGLAFFVHAVATLVVLHAPAVAAAFARGGRARRPAEE
jgi:hypothetical protein